MSSDQSARPVLGRRGVVRTLMGGGALAAIGSGAALAPAAAAQAQTGQAQQAHAGSAQAEAAPSPFAAEEFTRSGRVREYWIQAESFQHNAVPNGYDGMMGTRFTPEQTTYWAIGYRAYTQDWGSPLPADQGPDGIGANSGIPGPVIRAEVGDIVRVHFRNNDDHYRWPHSIHPHGVWYAPDSDGAWLAGDPKRPGTAVAYGETYTYTWEARPSSVGTWPYHDHSMPQSMAKAGATARPDMDMDGVMELGAQLGLFGVIAVTDRHTHPVDREFVLFLHDLYREDVPSVAQDLDLFNGGAFLDNTPTFRAKVGDRVRWRIAALGREFHVFHIHGHRWSAAGRRLDSQLIGPAMSMTVEYLEDNPGDWLYHCHVSEHMAGGMVGRYLVSP